MIDHNFEKRLTSTKVFYSYLSDIIGNFKAVKTAKSILDEQFQNKIQTVHFGQNLAQHLGLLFLYLTWQ